MKTRHGTVTRLYADRRASAVLEFAIVSVPFLGLTLGLAVVALDFMLQQSLDYALQQATRQVQLGLVPSTETAGIFIADVLCPALVPFAACRGITVTLQPVADYQTAPVVPMPGAGQLGIGGEFCIGLPGQLMFARAIYLAPVISQFWPYAAQVTINGATGTALVSSAAFANENPSGAPYPPATGC